MRLCSGVKVKYRVAIGRFLSTLGWRGDSEEQGDGRLAEAAGRTQVDEQRTSRSLPHPHLHIPRTGGRRFDLGAVRRQVLAVLPP